MSRNPHELQTAAYLRGMRAGEGANSAFVFLTPDILLGEGTYGSMVRLAESGKRVHLVAGIRMLVEGAVSCVAQHLAPNSPEAAIPSRDLVRFMLDNPHPITNGHIVSDGRVYAAQHLYHRIGDHGLLCRGFHLHPLLVWPREHSAVIRNTLDDEYVSRACPDRADWHTVTDSDELCVVEFSEATHKTGMVGRAPLTNEQLHGFLAHGTTPDHREHVLHSIRFHALPLNEADWVEPEARLDAFVRRCFDLLACGVASKAPPTGPVERPAEAPVAPPQEPPPRRTLLRRILSRAKRLFHRRLEAQLEAVRNVAAQQSIQIDQMMRQIELLSRFHEDMMERTARIADDTQNAMIVATRAESFARTGIRRAA